MVPFKSFPIPSIFSTPPVKYPPPFTLTIANPPLHPANYFSPDPANYLFPSLKLFFPFSSTISPLPFNYLSSFLQLFLPRLCQLFIPFPSTISPPTLPTIYPLPFNYFPFPSTISPSLQLFLPLPFNYFPLPFNYFPPSL